MRKLAAITGVLLLLLCLAGCGLQLEAPQTVSRETLEELHSSLQPEPQPQPEPTLIDDIIWFFSGLLE